MRSIRKILVGRDFSRISDRAFLEAFKWAQETQAELHVVHIDTLAPVAPRGAAPGTATHTSPLDRLKALLHVRTEELAQHAGLSIEGVHIVHRVLSASSAAKALVGYARDEAMDIIFVGTHGRTGIRRAALGSVAEEIIRHSPVPVLTIRSREDVDLHLGLGVTHILATVDLSDYSRAALIYGAEVAQLFGAKLTVLTVVEHPVWPPSSVTWIEEGAYRSIASEGTEALLHRFIASTHIPTVETQVIARLGTPVTTIQEVGEEVGADLIITATHGATGLARFMLGSVAEGVARHASVPVLTVRPPELVPEPTFAPDSQSDMVPPVY